jgi:glutamyl-tRNA reductase
VPPREAPEPLSVVVVGLEHKQAPLDLLEQVAVGEADAAKVLASLGDRVNLEEAVLLSTCLRTEVYAVVDRFHDAVHEVQEVLADTSGLTAADVEEHLTIRFDDDVPEHLFAVAAGLESAVPGESEVLGQVRRAFERAQRERVCGPILAELFRHALRTGKRVRSETAIARGTTSFSHAAVAMAETTRGGLAGTTTVVLGAGEVGSGVVRALAGLPAERRPGEIVVSNRTAERASALVAEIGTSAIVRTAAFEDLGSELAEADVVVSALEGTPQLLGAASVAPSGTRSGRPLLAVDLGMPRNFGPGARSVPGVTVLDMDDIASSVTQALEERRGETDEARAIVAEEVARYRQAARARGAAPVIASLRSRLDDVRVAELDRRRSQFGALDDAEWAQIDSITRAVLAKLLHEPTVLLRETAGTPRGERMVEALRVLFDL